MRMRDITRNRKHPDQVAASIMQWRFDDFEDFLMPIISKGERFLMDTGLVCCNCLLIMLPKTRNLLSGKKIRVFPADNLRFICPQKSFKFLIAGNEYTIGAF